jgi:hypothetical protein
MCKAAVQFTDHSVPIELTYQSDMNSATVLYREVVEQQCENNNILIGNFYTS